MDKEIRKETSTAGYSADAIRLKRKERDRLVDLAKTFESELATQTKHVYATLKRLKTECGVYLSDNSTITNRASTVSISHLPHSASLIAHTRLTLSFLSQVSVFLQTCVLPRVALSHADATYVSFFVEKLQVLRTPWFSTITYLNTLLGMMQALSFSRTHYEGTALGLSQIRHTLFYLSAGDCLSIHRPTRD